MPRSLGYLVLTVRTFAAAHVGAEDVRRGGRFAVPPAPGLGAVVAFRRGMHV